MVEALESRWLFAAYVVHHTPYLQPGNAPLVGYPGADTDRVK